MCNGGRYRDKTLARRASFKIKTMCVGRFTFKNNDNNKCTKILQRRKPYLGFITLYMCLQRCGTRGILHNIRLGLAMHVYIYTPHTTYTSISVEWFIVAQDDSSRIHFQVARRLHQKDLLKLIFLYTPMGIVMRSEYRNTRHIVHKIPALC